MVEAGAAAVAGGGGVSFPVVFFDGEQEADIGSVVVYPYLDFRSFQSILSRKIGISPHQFSVYLKSQAQPSRKLAMSGKINFAAIVRERSCFFYVVLKRSRRERRKKGNKENKGGEEACLSPPIRKNNPPANVMLLRRGMGIENVTVDSQAYPGFLSPLEYEKRVRNLQMEREKFLLNMGLRNLGLGERQERKTTAPAEDKDKNANDAVCEECLVARKMGKDPGFHWCVYDAVTFGFRSPAGPIARPVKGSD